MKQLAIRFVAACLLGALATSALAQRSTWVDIVAPDTVRVNQPLTAGAFLRDVYTNAPIVGRKFEVSFGDEWRLHGTVAFWTNNSGWASRTWSFSQPGLFRVTFGFRGDSQYVDSRRTALIRVIR